MLNMAVEKGLRAARFPEVSLPDTQCIAIEEQLKSVLENRLSHTNNNVTTLHRSSHKHAHSVTVPIMLHSLACRGVKLSLRVTRSSKAYVTRSFSSIHNAKFSGTNFPPHPSIRSPDLSHVKRNAKRSNIVIMVPISTAIKNRQCLFTVAAAVVCVCVCVCNDAMLMVGSSWVGYAQRTCQLSQHA